MLLGAQTTEADNDYILVTLEQTTTLTNAPCFLAKSLGQGFYIKSAPIKRRRSIDFLAAHSGSFCSTFCP